jgi:acetyltransferase-like isoleucine patch superfamily enzyme
MINIEYYYSKILKILQGRAIKESKIHRTSKIEPGSHTFQTIMEKHSFCGYNCELMHCNIGSFCSIANNVFIGGSMHSIEHVSTSPAFEKGKNSIKAKYYLHPLKPTKRTIIGHDVWIGHGAIIKQGVNIGTGSVIGMGSIVTKDIEPYSIVAGNPAKEIRKRFEKEIIEGLLESKWWEFDDNQLKKYAPYFNDPAEFLNKLK